MTQVAAEREDAEGYFALAGRLKAAGRYEESLDAYGHAARLRADFAEAHCDGGIALHELGRFAEAVRAHDRALAARPGYAKAHCYRGRALDAGGDHAAALEAFARAIEARPGYAKAHFFTGLTLKETGRAEAAIAAFRRAIGLKPGYDKAHYTLSITLLARGDKSEALRVCDDFLAGHPGHTRLLGFKAVVLREMGRDEEARTLMDLERFSSAHKITTPSDFNDLQDFNQALAEQVLGHSSLVREPTSRATRHGMHTGEILADAEGAIAALKGNISQHVKTYMADVETYRTAVPADDPHPFLAARPDKWRLGGWSVVMESEGHELTHIHPQGWLSGVYYVRVPKAVGGAGDAHDGWLELGRPRDHYPCRRAHPVVALKPEEGLMRMFPSFFYHRTIAFESDEKRICIAFDVIPL